MKIRTRLLLFLLPTLIGSITLVSSLLAYNWYGEIVGAFKSRLQTATLSTAALLDSKTLSQEDLASNSALSRELSQIQQELGVSRLYLLAPNSPEITVIPKDFQITKVHLSQHTHHKVMTGYAPLYDEQGHVSGLVAADIEVHLIDAKFKETLLLIALCSGLTIALMVVMLFVIANKISKPVQKLNNSALAIAAGCYGEAIQVDGPKEIAELSNTLNTMSECLQENINHLKENSLLRERMYGEYECSMLLQHLMLQKNINQCHIDAFAVRALTFFSDTPRGLLLDLPKKGDQNQFIIHLAEAKEAGFEGMYELLTQYNRAKTSSFFSTLILDCKKHTLSFEGTHIPVVWSLEKKSLVEQTEGTFSVESGDFVFLFNQGLIHYFQRQETIEHLLTKVLQVFAKEGFDTTASMLQKEIGFFIKKRENEHDLHLLCFQVLV